MVLELLAGRVIKDADSEVYHSNITAFSEKTRTAVIAECQSPSFRLHKVPYLTFTAFHVEILVWDSCNRRKCRPGELPALRTVARTEIGKTVWDRYIYSATQARTR
jgi:hypothetical protein